MGKQKTKQTVTHAWKAPPETADVSALREMKATADPSIPFQYSKARQNYANTFANPLGSYTSPSTKEAAARVTNQALAQDEAQALEQSQFNANNANFGRQATVAQMTAPTLVNTGGTQTQSGGFWSGLLQQGIGAGAQLGSAALMAILIGVFLHYV